MSELTKKQLEKVQYADLSQFNSETNTYHIKTRVDIKLEVDSCYLIKIKPSMSNNFTVITNWNNGNTPAHEYLKVDVAKVMGKMVRVIGIAYDFNSGTDLSYFWSGWLSTDDIEILGKL